MSLYQVNKLLRDMNCSMELANRCQSEPEAVDKSELQLGEKIGQGLPGRLASPSS